MRNSQNYHAVTTKRELPRSTCRLCGECDIGCNYGSKNTLDYTYITAAIHQKPHPAKVETLCEVKAVSPLDGVGYKVEFVRHKSETIDPATGKCPATGAIHDHLQASNHSGGNFWLALHFDAESRMRFLN